MRVVLTGMSTSYKSKLSEKSEMEETLSYPGSWRERVDEKNGCSFDF
jgi:hypothetical protein